MNGKPEIGLCKMKGLIHEKIKIEVPSPTEKTEMKETFHHAHPYHILLLKMLSFLKVVCFAGYFWIEE